MDTLLCLLGRKDEGATVFRRFGNYLPVRHDINLPEKLNFQQCKCKIFTLHNTSLVYFLIWRVRKIAKSDYQLRQVCPTVHMRQLGSHWTDFHEILHLSIFRKSVEKIQVSLKLTSITGTLHEDLCTFMIISR